MRRFNLTYCAILGMAGILTVSCSKEEVLENESAIVEDNAISQQNQQIEDSYIVVFDTKVTGDVSRRFSDDYVAAREAVRLEAQRIFSDHWIEEAEIFASYGKVINGVAAKLSKEDAAKLAEDERVSYVEQDQLVTFVRPSDEEVTTMSTQETPWGITRVNGIVEYSGSEVAWILDTGIDLDHPDLNVDPSRGFNAFTRGRDAKSLDDNNGHGSHVSGTIAALNNDIGVIGVAPGATVIPIKVLDGRGSGSYSGVIAGIDHVAANGNSGDVANMSLGGPVSQAVDDAVLAASENGIKFVLAAGNDSDDANNYSPARVNGPNIYTISAMNSSDGWASFSNYANPPIDYCAPGVSIKSTWKNGGYNTISGTSMATPHAAGILLIGNASTDGTVNGDPDGNADPIIVH